MSSFVVRFLVGLLLALALSSAALARPAQAATTWQVLIGGESADQSLVGKVSGGAEAEHRVDSRNEAVGFNVCANVDFSHCVRL